MNELAAVICSPPWADVGGHDNYDGKYQRFIDRKTDGGKLGQSIGAGYGRTVGQLGGMAVGDLAAILTSPPFADVTQGTNGSFRELRAAWNADPKNKGKPGQSDNQGPGYSHRADADDYGRTAGQLGAMPPGTPPGESPMQCEELDWPMSVCYGQGWGDLICPEAFAHPAKMARGLLGKILDTCLERGFLTPGSLVADPFGGVGTTGLLAAYRGLRAVSVELEKKFHTLSNKNYLQHAEKEWCTCGDEGNAYLRELRRVISEAESGSGTQPEARHETVLSSGVLAGGIEQDTPGPGEPQLERGTVRQPKRLRRDSRKRKVKAGTSAPDGTASRQATGGSGVSPPQGRGQNEQRPEQPGDSHGIEPHEASPPARAEAQATQPDLSAVWNGVRDDRQRQGGTGDLQIPGVQEAAAARVRAEASRQAGSWCPRCGKLIVHFPRIRLGDSRDFARIVGEAGGIVTSPPYADSETFGTDQNNGMRGKRPGKNAGQRGEYGTSPGQLGAMPPGDVAAVLNGVVTSPPYGDCLDTAQHGIKDERRSRNPSDIQTAHYGTTSGQVGRESGDTYWSAVRDIYAQCLLALRPGGWLVVVVKGYVSKRKLVDLPAQTAALLTHLGLDLRIVARAWLVERKEHAGLFGQTVVEEKSRESFFRRLAVKKGSPRIPFETVLFCQKPEGGPGGGIDAAVTSPPYAECVKGDHAERETAGESQAKRRTRGGSLGQSQRNGGYGVSEGQLGALPAGNLDDVLKEDQP